MFGLCSECRLLVVMFILVNGLLLKCLLLVLIMLWCSFICMLMKYWKLVVL